MIGQVTGYEISKNKDGDNDVLNLQVQISSDDDVQTVEMYSQAGEDTNPATGSDVIVIPISESWKIGIASGDGITPSMNPGEKKIYSVDAGAIAAFINLLTNGNLQLNGSGDFAVRFNELKTGFDELKDDMNSFITTYGGHTHVETGGTTLPTTSSGTPSTASIDTAKVETVEIIGV